MGSEALNSVPGSRRTSLSTYRLADGVQVRREKFGLLFYNYRGPRLYFLPSKSLISDKFFDGQQTLGELVDAIQKKHALPRRQIRNHIDEILQLLEVKGLIHGQPIC